MLFLRVICENCNSILDIVFGGGTFVANDDIKPIQCPSCLNEQFLSINISEISIVGKA